MMAPIRATMSGSWNWRADKFMATALSIPGMNSEAFRAKTW
jgi:hypothetical protein